MEISKKFYLSQYSKRFNTKDTSTRHKELTIKTLGLCTLRLCKNCSTFHDAILIDCMNGAHHFMETAKKHDLKDMHWYKMILFFFIIHKKRGIRRVANVKGEWLAWNEINRAWTWTVGVGCAAQFSWIKKWPLIVYGVFEGNFIAQSLRLVNPKDTKAQRHKELT